MYNYYGAMVSAILIPLTILIVVLVAWLVIIDHFVKVAERAKIPTSKGMLWFMGFFASPLGLGLYICAEILLGNRTSSNEVTPADINRQLPRV